ncbi:uncharacterized protein SEPMUDRAFT_112425 [Sphaerulina musiva SO2202]|uniref:Mitochondrial carrier n=1 Tax=Sphaerulina musiva (strain SO2202) TaxID=692275 RepID=N1QGR8_SPHMS|nr:uncharacterized protein SEPMUDRAFT_112425 [Sphaerulina musiva SO2202]EMF16375.1 hypothetical protein SEPMUDRAFT_112425 [Sphaerulina musiva SO2202]
MATSTPKSQDVQRQPIRYPLWFGGTASSCAAGVTHPLDLMKVELNSAQQFERPDSHSQG